MAILDWNQELSLGNTLMDETHVEFVHLLNELAEAPAGAVLDRLDEFIRHTEAHFAEEETYMGSIAYPGLATHKHIHTTLLAKLDEHAAGVAKRTEPGLPDTLFGFLKLWLSAHICGIDTKYAEHARTHKKAS